MKKNAQIFFWQVFIVFFIAVNAVVAKSPKVMTPVDILNIPVLLAPAVSSDGKRVVYIRYSSQWEKNTQIADLWLSKSEQGESQQLTMDDAAESKVLWSPEEKYISFLVKRQKDTYKRIYLLPLTGGEAFPVTQHAADIEDYQWSQDGSSLYFLADQPIADDIIKRKQEQDDMFPFEEALNYRHIWKLDIKKRAITQITKGKQFVTQFSLSPDNSIIVFKRARGLLIDDEHDADLWVIASKGGEEKRITSNTFAEFKIQVSPDNKKVLFIADVNEKGEYYYDANVFVVSIATGKVTPIAIDQSFEVEYAQWSKNSKHIYIQANMGVHSELWRLNIDGGVAKQLTNGQHTVKHWSYNAAADKHVFVLTTASNPGEIFLLPAGGGKPKPVTSEYTELENNYRMPKQQPVRWKAYDGTILEGLLSLPLEYKKNKRYPLVVHTHGGPRSSDQYGQFRWRTYIPVLSAMGYAYFTPNYRGGRGYGDEFMRDMVGGYFNSSHRDVMSAVDYLIDQGIADPKKLIAAGWSAGGHMTNKLITHTNRFAAASSGAGAIDWVSMYGESDTRYGRTPWFGGTPWQKNAPLAAYRHNSPLKDIWRVKTPTLIFVGEEDKRVPPTQSIILYRALRDQGVESKLYIAPREKHGFKELRHRLFKINAELDWFEHFVHGKDYQWQRAPN